MASNSETDSDVTEALTNVEPDDEWDNNSVCDTYKESGTDEEEEL